VSGSALRRAMVIILLCVGSDLGEWFASAFDPVAIATLLLQSLDYKG